MSGKKTNDDIDADEDELELEDELDGGRRRRRTSVTPRARARGRCLRSFAMGRQWCSTCSSDVLAETNESNGFTCCTTCGKILDEHAFSTDPTFSKNAQTGGNVPDGVFVLESGIAPGLIRASRGGRLYGVQLDSHERTLYRGKLEITQITDRLGIRPRDDIVDSAHRLYKLAVQRNFTRGRRVNQVAGACLYIICRQESRPYMLIDFSDVLQTNVYVLGAVFLQLCRLLRLEQHPLMQKPIDPSLFIHRFADKLNLGRRMHTVANTALRLVASMKRDWMQTGRRPNGICGAALWVAAHIHGFSPSKRDVVSVVHIGEATLKKRLTEFENTPSAALSVEEFDAQARTFEIEEEANQKVLSLPESSMSVLSCMHKDSDNTPHFAQGMCRTCYIDYVRVSGGSFGGSDPPSFARSRLMRKEDEEKAQLLLPSTSSDRITVEFNTALAEGGLVKLLDLREEAISDSSQQLALVVPVVEPHAPTMTKVTEQLVVKTLQQKPLDPAFLLHAEDALRLLVGSRWAEMFCLPFTVGKARGTVTKQHMFELHPKFESFANSEGEHITLVDESVLHFLISAGCFDESALNYLNKFSHHDIKQMVVTEFNPPFLASNDPNENGLVAKEENTVLDTLSDVDDDEIKAYIHNDDEVKLRRVIWSEMNKEYLEYQASKEVARLPSSTKQKRSRQQQALSTAETPAAAAHQALSRKKGSSKINYEALENLFKAPSLPTSAPREQGLSKAQDVQDVQGSKKKSERLPGLPTSVPSASKQSKTASARPSSLTKMVKKISK